MSVFQSECRKFQPNIFNKSKCSNCFRHRDEHSEEALESNRASRKVSKCGYLFVAPDWDFSIPLNRTKRWQRRWFVLYDDGELTYSVDDLPATIPQGVIDMNRVLEVTEAEDVTGNLHALAITSPDRATFVKGTCREESRWWKEVLVVFPGQLKHGRHKRNATFPGIKTSSVLQQSREAYARASTPMNSSQKGNNSNQRNRFTSCDNELASVARPSSAPTLCGLEEGITAADSNSQSSNNDIFFVDRNAQNCNSLPPFQSNASLQPIQSTSPLQAFHSVPPLQSVHSSILQPFSTSSLHSFHSTPPLHSVSLHITSSSHSIPTYSNTLIHSIPVCSTSLLRTTHPSKSVQVSASTSLQTHPPINPQIHSTHLHSALIKPVAVSSEYCNESSPPVLQGYQDNPPTSESPPTQDKVLGHPPRSRRAEIRAAHGRNPRSKSEVSLLPPFSAFRTTTSQNSANILPNSKNFQNVSNNFQKSSNNLQNSSTNFNHSNFTPITSSLDFNHWKSRRRYTTSLTTSSPALVQSSYVSPFISNSLRSGVGFGNMEENSPENYNSVIRYSDFPSMKRFLKSYSDFNHVPLNNSVNDATPNYSNDKAATLSYSRRQLKTASVDDLKRDEKLKHIADSITRPWQNGTSQEYVYKSRVNGVPSSYSRSQTDVRPTRDIEMSDVSNKHSRLSDVTDSKSKLDHLECSRGLSSNTASVGETQRVALPAEEVLVGKKGWLMRKTSNHDWTKHWFVLEGRALKFFRDPSSEDTGILDGIVDLGMSKLIKEVENSRNYAFFVQTWDDKKHFFSSVTANIRSNWISVMKNAANLSENNYHRPVKTSQSAGVGARSSLKSDFTTAKAKRPLSNTSNISFNQKYSRSISQYSQDESFTDSPFNSCVETSSPVSRTNVSPKQLCSPISKTNLSPKELVLPISKTYSASSSSNYSTATSHKELFSPTSNEVFYKNMIVQSPKQTSSPKAPTVGDLNKAINNRPKADYCSSSDMSDENTFEEYKTASDSSFSNINLNSKSNEPNYHPPVNSNKSDSPKFKSNRHPPINSKKSNQSSNNSLSNFDSCNRQFRNDSKQLVSNLHISDSNYQPLITSTPKPPSYKSSLKNSRYSADDFSSLKNNRCSIEVFSNKNLTSVESISNSSNLNHENSDISKSTLSTSRKIDFSKNLMTDTEKMPEKSSSKSSLSDISTNLSTLKSNSAPSEEPNTVPKILKSSLKPLKRTKVSSSSLISKKSDEEGPIFVSKVDTSELNVNNKYTSPYNLVGGLNGSSVGSYKSSRNSIARTVTDTEITNKVPSENKDANSSKNDDKTCKSEIVTTFLQSRINESKFSNNNDSKTMTINAKDGKKKTEPAEKVKVETIATGDERNEVMIESTVGSKIEVEETVKNATIRREAVENEAKRENVRNDLNKKVINEISFEDSDIIKKIKELKDHLTRSEATFNSEKLESLNLKELVEKLRFILAENSETQKGNQNQTNLKSTNLILTKLPPSKNLVSTLETKEPISKEGSQQISPNSSDASKPLFKETSQECDKISKKSSQSISVSKDSLADKRDTVLTNNDNLSLKKDNFTVKKRRLHKIRSLRDLSNFDKHFDAENSNKETLLEEYSNVKLRFEKALTEIHALKKQLKNSEEMQDKNDLLNHQLNNGFKAQKNDFEAQFKLMEARLQDLTNKLSASEKQVRSLKAKISRAESRDRRRTLSLKGKESFNLSKDLEGKISQLEAKMNSLSDIKMDSTLDTKINILSIEETNMSKCFQNVDENSNNNDNNSSNNLRLISSAYELKELRPSKSDDPRKSTKQRCKSLDGSGQSQAENALKAVVRLNALEEKVGILSGSKLQNFKPLKKVSSCLSLMDSNCTSVAGIPNSKSPIISPANSRLNLSRSRGTWSKSRKNDSETKLLREKLALEKIVDTLHIKLGECMQHAVSLETPPKKDESEIRLKILIDSVLKSYDIVKSRHVPPEHDYISKSLSASLKLQQFLRDKILQLSEKRHELRVAGKWNREAQLKLFAERLAFESVLVCGVAQSAISVRSEVDKPEIEGKTDIENCKIDLPTTIDDSRKLQELIECHRNISFLERKLTDTDFDMASMSSLEFYTSLLAEKLVISGDVWATLSNCDRKIYSSVKATSKDLVNKLLERGKSLELLLNTYKGEKLNEIAQLIIVNSNLSDGFQLAHTQIKGNFLKQLRSLVDEILNKEVSNIELCNSVARIGHLLVPESYTLDLVQSSCNVTETLQSTAEDSVSKEIENFALILSRKCEELKLLSYEYNEYPNVEFQLKEVMSEFAAVLAQKALVDGQLLITTVEESELENNLKIVVPTRNSVKTHMNEVPIYNDKVSADSNSVELLESCGDVVASEAHLLMFLGGGNRLGENIATSAMNHAELIFLFNKFKDISTQQCQYLSSKEDSSNSNAENCNINTSAAPNILKRPPSPKLRRKSDTSATKRARRASDVTGMTESLWCRQCEELKQEISRLKKAKKATSKCEKCQELLNLIKNTEDEHRISVETLENEHKAELHRLRDQVKFDPPTRDCDDELTELKRRLCLLEEGYEAQIASLKKQYSEALGSQSDLCEETIRQRYQHEIDHLRELCEKGLSAMEASHKRVVNEMEATHNREISQLRREKEEALAEETQATLAALDAMRKAHEAEVEKEIIKFKEEWLRKMEDGRDSNNQKHEQQELRAVRSEILALSEKFSSKCLEMAAKEQKIESLQRQLAEAKSQFRSLEERNRILKQRINCHLCHVLEGPESVSLETKNSHKNFENDKNNSKTNKTCETSKIAGVNSNCTDEV